jgi:hypothetical protein
MDDDRENRRFKQDEQVYINFNLFHGMKGLSKILFKMTFFQILNIINFVFRIKNDSLGEHFFFCPKKY